MTMENRTTVFYVDDNLKSSRLLTSVLEECRFRVITSHDPFEARGLCKRTSFDLALLDYEMPGMTGSELAQEIKFLVPDVPVVLISGYAALPPTELVFVDAHFGLGTALDDLLWTMRTLTGAQLPTLLGYRDTAHRHDAYGDNAHRGNAHPHRANAHRDNAHPQLRDFVLNATLPGTMDKLFFMPAGRKDEAYQSEMSRLDWKVFYKQKKGYLFVENLKAAINDVFKPDYVLIDSRTGLTDISGICTLQLPHLVVLLFSLNEQNVIGTSQIYRSIKNNKINRSIATLLVASPVPDMPEWVTVRGQRFEYARKTIGSTVDVVVPYDPFLAFQESLIDYQEGEEAKTYLSKAYDTLSEKVIGANSTDVLTLLKKAIELRDEGNLDLAELHYREVVETRSDSPDAWIEFGKFARLRGRATDACEYFERALTLRPTDSEVLSHLATAYASVDKHRAAEYFREFVSREMDVGRIERISTIVRETGLAELSLEGYQRMIELDSKRMQTYFDLGETHMRLRHYRQAADAYKRAADLEPTALAATYNAGYALSQVEDPTALTYFERAIELWEQMDKSSFSSAVLANTHEAISNAYLAAGKPEKAVEELKRSLLLAAGLARTRLFSSIRYMNIPQPKFVAEAQQLLENAQRRLKHKLEKPAVPGVIKSNVN